MLGLGSRLNMRFKLSVTGLYFCVSKQAHTFLTENERVANSSSAYSLFLFTYKALFKRNIQKFYGILLDIIQNHFSDNYFMNILINNML